YPPAPPTRSPAPTPTPSGRGGEGGEGRKSAVHGVDAKRWSPRRGRGVAQALESLRLRRQLRDRRRQALETRLQEQDNPTHDNTFGEPCFAL
ncbi:MAG: hypothetical protein AAF471_07725, partial [Myxococcota bacterium]